MTTDYIHPTLEIVGSYYRDIMFSRAYGFKKVVNKCLDMDNACHTCFSGTGNIFVMNF